MTFYEHILLKREFFIFVYVVGFFFQSLLLSVTKILIRRLTLKNKLS